MHRYNETFFYALILTLFGTLTASADDRVYVNQATSGKGSIFVPQTSELADRRVVQRRVAQPQTTQRTNEQPQTGQPDARILELSSSGIPQLPNAHIAVE